MRFPWLGAFAIVSLSSCSSTREPPHPAPVVSLQTPSANAAAPTPPESVATITTATPAVSAAEPVIMTAPSAKVASHPAPYPETWIRQSRSENLGLSCTELVYKNGCSETRTGIVTFRVTIDENGSVEQFSEIDNQIAHDKALVSRCLKRNLPKWKFHPPEGHERTFEVQVALADRC